MSHFEPLLVLIKHPLATAHIKHHHHQAVVKPATGTAALDRPIAEAGETVAVHTWKFLGCQVVVKAATQTTGYLMVNEWRQSVVTTH